MYNKMSSLEFLANFSSLLKLVKPREDICIGISIMYVCFSSMILLGTLSCVATEQGSLVDDVWNAPEDGVHHTISISMDLDERDRQEQSKNIVALLEKYFQTIETTDYARHTFSRHVRNTGIETTSEEPSNCSEPTLEPNSNTGDEPGAEPESEPGAEPENEPNVEPESEPGAEPESTPSAASDGVPSAESESKPGADSSGPESEPIAESGSEPSVETDPNVDPDCESIAGSESEPSTEPESDSRAESENDPIAEPEGESSAEPEGEPIGEPELGVEPEPEQWPEPGPNWHTALTILGVALPVHLYLYPVAFSGIAIYALYVVITLLTDRKQISTRSLSITLNGILLLCGVSRALSLFLNPYGNCQTFSLPLSRIMWSIGFPCLTSSMSTLLLVLLDTTKLSLAPPKFQKFSTIASVCAGHFILVLGVDLTVTQYLELKVLLVFCQLIYIVWSFLLGLGFSTVAYKMRRNFGATFNDRNSSLDAEDKKALRLYRSVVMCGIAGFVQSITHIYGAVGVFGVYSPVSVVEAWPWWSFQTLMRSEEIAMCILVFVLAGKTRKISGLQAMSAPLLRCFKCVKRQLRQNNTNKVGPTAADGNLPAQNHESSKGMSVSGVDVVSGTSDAGYQSIQIGTSSKAVEYSV